MNVRQGCYLAIDWGEKKVGLALGHTETGVAVAYAVWPHNHAFFKKIQTLIETEQVVGVVLGISKRHQHDRTHPIHAFESQLQQGVSVPVIVADEMFTTRLAQQTLRATGGRHVAKSDDAEAARILLQDWFSRVRSDEGHVLQ